MQSRAQCKEKPSGHELHQQAINSLLDISMELGEILPVPIQAVPNLFRNAVKHASKHPSSNLHSGEIAIIEHALLMIERNGGDATVRTPDLVDFYNSLGWSLDAEEKLRVTYLPKNPTVQ